MGEDWWGRTGGWGGEVNGIGASQSVHGPCFACAPDVATEAWFVGFAFLPPGLGAIQFTGIGPNW